MGEFEQVQTMIEQVKKMILQRIDTYKSSEEIKVLADAYATLCTTEVQAKMTTWQTGMCPPNCPDCGDDLDATEIG